MFTHPSLLREMTLLAEFLRRSGEGDWARRVIQAADAIRKSGWTEQGGAHLQSLFKGEPSLFHVSFGAEHARWLPAGELDRANQRLERHRLKLADLGTQPHIQPPAAGPRQRSPDLA
jgi:hypothetical protein